MATEALHIVGGAFGSGFFGRVSLRKVQGKGEAMLTRKQAFQVLEEIDQEYRTKAFLVRATCKIMAQPILERFC